MNDNCEILKQVQNDKAVKNDKVKGFTLIELLVTAVILAVVLAIVFPILSHHRALHKTSELIEEAQQNARTSIDMMVKEIRSAGYGVDNRLRQLPVCYAGPWDICINANINPRPDTAPPGKAPQAMRVTASPLPAVYNPGMTYETGAETIRWGLDWNNDGKVDEADQNYAFPTITENPNDIMLLRRVYGYNPASASNGGIPEPVAVLRGPFGGVIHPLFTYWLDDGTMTGALWGDTDNDGKLSETELASLTPVPQAQLKDIIRVTITVIGESQQKDARYDLNNGYRQIVLTSEVELKRNPPPWLGAESQEIIDGYSYWDKNLNKIRDAGEPGRDRCTLRLSPGGLETIVDYSGFYRFFLPPANYQITLYPPYGWTTTTTNPVNIPVTSEAHVDFGLRPLYPLGFIKGVVFEDANVNQVQDAGEDGIGKVEITVDLGEKELTSDYTGAYCVEVFEGNHIVQADPLMNYASTTHDSVMIYVTPPDTEVVNFGHVYVGNDTTAPTVTVIYPNGGEVFTAGDTVDIMWAATDDIIVKSITIKYIYVATWITIAEGEDNDGVYSWVVPNTPSTICKVKIIAIDGRGNIGEDESDFLFTIQSP